MDVVLVLAGRVWFVVCGLCCVAVAEGCGLEGRACCALDWLFGFWGLFTLFQEPELLSYFCQPAPVFL